jgi:hypothetical protein
MLLVGYCCTTSAASSYHDHLINILYANAMGKGKPKNGWDYVEDLCRNLNGLLTAVVLGGVLYVIEQNW